MPDLFYIDKRTIMAEDHNQSNNWTTGFYLALNSYNKRLTTLARALFPSYNMYTHMGRWCNNKKDFNIICYRVSTAQ